MLYNVNLVLASVENLTVLVRTKVRNKKKKEIRKRVLYLTQSQTVVGQMLFFTSGTKCIWITALALL